ncbi:transposase [Streptomyces sp. NPDC002187]|uniref:transposase n=1 Tax=Streptomyces sp. NPDC002187 TaxID=3364637 RepID=UPI0036AEC0E4
MRIIEYTVTIRPQAGPPRTQTLRLVTSLLDHQLAPAHQLAMANHQRWEIENGFAELKNRLRGSGFILRSKAPELIYQEVYALLTVYQALCALQIRAAEYGAIDPDRISFTLQLARLKVADQAAADVITLDAACREVVTEMLAALLPARRDRSASASRSRSRTRSRSGNGTSPAPRVTSTTYSESPNTPSGLRKRGKSPALGLSPGTPR